MMKLLTFYTTKKFGRKLLILERAVTFSRLEKSKFLQKLF